nr:MAG TPA: hypothetical protein [Caudoviricetes sp.]
MSFHPSSTHLNPNMCAEGMITIPSAPRCVRDAPIPPAHILRAIKSHKALICCTSAILLYTPKLQKQCPQH